MCRVLSYKEMWKHLSAMLNTHISFKTQVVLSNYVYSI